MDQLNAAKQHPANRPKPNLVFGWFGDKKDAHHVTSRVCRDLTIKKLYLASAYKVEGFSPPEVPADLKTLREAAPAAEVTALSVTKMICREGKLYFSLPDVGSLAFSVSEGTKKKVGGDPSGDS